MNSLTDCRTQWSAVADFFDELNTRMDRLPDTSAQEQNHQMEAAA
jgi:hypothetical protein